MLKYIETNDKKKKNGHEKVPSTNNAHCIQAKMPLLSENRHCCFFFSRSSLSIFFYQKQIGMNIYTSVFQTSELFRLRKRNMRT